MWARAQTVDVTNSSIPTSTRTHARLSPMHAMQHARVITHGVTASTKTSNARRASHNLARMAPPSLSRASQRITSRALIARASSADANAASAQKWIDAWKTGGSSPSAPASADGVEGFELRRSKSTVADAKEAGTLSTTSFGTIGLSVGLQLLIYGFGAYFSFLPGSDVSALMLIYGFPISLIGFALKYAELEPLSCVTYENALRVRDEQTTPILTQLRNDVTRYRYGDEQHLEEALKLVFRFNRPGGLRRNQAPELVGLSEQVINDRYALCLEFESPKMAFSEWTDRVAKITGFFGPGVVAAATKMNGDEHKVEIALITTGEGGGEMQDMEVLPPLAPGQPARYVKRGTA